MFGVMGGYPVTSKTHTAVEKDKLTHKDINGMGIMNQRLTSMSQIQASLGSPPADVQILYSTPADGDAQVCQFLLLTQ